MDPERWNRLEAICHAALQRAPAERQTFLDDACGTDPSIRRDAERLLAELAADPGFLETPLVQLGAVAPEVPDPESLRFGPFRVVRPLGRGGMGDVFLGVRDLDGTAQYVAVKVIRRGMDSDEVLRRFHQERGILARLSHPNIAHLIDGGATDDGRPYFVMEYVEGEPIDGYCERLGLSIAGRLRLLEAVCGALQHAHAHLVVHRDLKPSNILVTGDGSPKLLDFGIGKVLDAAAGEGGERTRSEVRVLTPEYAAPEQVRGEPVTTATDVHGLGVLLYRLLTGRHPYAMPGRSVEEVERAICEEEPARPSRVAAPGLRRRLAGDLDTIVLRALRKEPGRRYDSPGALADDLRRHLDGLPVAARPDTFGYRAAKFVRRNVWPVTAAAVLGLALVGLSAMTLAHSRQVARERDAAIEVRNFLLESFGARGADRDAPVAARELLDQQAATLAFAYGDRPALQAEMLQVVAEGYERLGLYQEAERRAREALALRQSSPSGNPADLAWSLEVLGWIRVRQEDRAEAESLLTRAVGLFRDAGSSGRRGLARALNDLGVLRQEAGDLAGAEAPLDEALDIRTRFFPREARGIGVTGSNLAALHYRLGNYRDAVARGEAALAALRQAVGPDHQRSIIAQSNLVTFRTLLGDFSRAEADLRDLFERQSRLQGREHPVTTRLAQQLANVLVRRGKAAEAEPLLQQALAAQERALGPAHTQVGVTLRSLSNVALALDSLDRALEYALRAVAVSQAALGRFHSETADAIAAVGEALGRMGRLAEAERTHREVVGVLDSVVGPRHPRTATERYRLGRILTFLNRHAEALDVLRTAHEVNAAGGPPPELQLIRLQMAYARLGLGQRAAAESLLAVVEAAVPPDSHDERTRSQLAELREALAPRR